MEQRHVMPTLVNTMQQLKKEGYTEDFNLGFDCVECDVKNIKMLPREFQIDSYYRFEGDTDPSDSSILYAISSEKHNIKGLMVNAYGVYSDPITDEMMDYLSIK